MTKHSNPTSLETKEFNYLKTHGADKIGQETMSLLQDNKIKLDGEPLYVRTKIGTSNDNELLTANLSESVGVTNIDKRKLPKFVNFIISKISFGYASAPLGTKVAEALAYTSFDNAIPAALQNADLIIKQNDQPLCVFPIKTFLREDKIRHAHGEAGYDLPYLVTIKEDVQFQILIKFPTGQSLDPNVDNFVEIFLRGARTKQRN